MFTKDFRSNKKKMKIKKVYDHIKNVYLMRAKVDNVAVTDHFT